LWSICIGANLQLSCFISPAHQTAKVAGNGSSNGWNCFCVNLTGGAIQGDVIAAADLLAAQLEVTIFIVHYDVAAAGYTAGTHTTSNNCCVRGHTAANGQDALCIVHTFDIFRRGLQTNQNNLLTFLAFFGCFFSSKYNFTASSTWGSSQTGADLFGSLQSFCIKLWVQQSI